jgi:hypothetical protein
MELAIVLLLTSYELSKLFSRSICPNLGKSTSNTLDGGYVAVTQYCPSEESDGREAGSVESSFNKHVILTAPSI